jgi:hypothetical protein
MELLRRCQEGTCNVSIEHALCINGGLFADGHTHPAMTTPLLKQPILGPMGTALAQRSNLMFDSMLKPRYGKLYRKTQLKRQELRETEKAIRCREGAFFMSAAAGFVDEHKKNGDRWNLASIYIDYCLPNNITLHLVGSQEDPFEHRQYKLAREQLGSYYPGVCIEIIPGGHSSMVEQAEDIANKVSALASKTSGITKSSLLGR